MDKPIVIRTFSSLAQAESAAAQLKASGIECSIQADDGGGMLPSLQFSEGVRLIVDASADVEANQVLEHSNLPPTAPPPLPHEGKPVIAQANSAFLPGLVVGVVLGISSLALYNKINEVRPRTYEYDNDHDGAPDETFYYKHGRLVKVVQDRNSDGYVDVWRDFERGLLARAASDENFDRKPDSWTTYSNINAVSAQMDTDFNGKPDNFYTYSNGVVIAEQQDTDHNGKPDVIYAFSNGVAQRADWRPNGQDVVVLSWRYVDGVCREELRDLDGDGKFDVSMKFDSFQNPTETNYFNLLTKPSP